VGRKLYEDIISPINVPHFRKSRMDGYAVRSEDTFGAEEDNLIKLNCIEIIEAGDIPKSNVRKGECAYVATTASAPLGIAAPVAT
jgi:molybdopterin biosynthesis enzyme